MPRLPISPSHDEAQQQGSPDSPARYPSLITRVSQHEHAEFVATAARSGQKPGSLLRSVIRAFLRGEKPEGEGTGARLKSRSKPVHPGDADLERFELRIASFLKTEVKQRAAREGMSSSEWVAALIQSVVTAEPVLTEREAEAVRFANRELAAVGRNLNQIARAMNRAELIGANFSKDEILTLHGISLLNKKVEKLRMTILSLITARNRAWGVADDSDS